MVLIFSMPRCGDDAIEGLEAGVQFLHQFRGE
jgi:hypothetical protein